MDGPFAANRVLGLIEVALEGLKILVLNVLHTLFIQLLNAFMNVCRYLIFEFFLDWTVIKILTPVAEIARDDEKSILVLEQFLQSLCVDRQIFWSNLAHHHRQKFDVVNPGAKHLVNEREMHFQTVLIFLRALLELDKLFAGILKKILGGLLINVEITKRSGPLVASCEADGLEREAVAWA